MTTRRLIIRPIEKRDYEDICEYGCDKEIGRYMMYWPKSKAQIEQFIEEGMAAQKLDKPSRYEWVIKLKDTGKVIGNITLYVRQNEGEMSWLSNRRYWNKGYMSEAVKAVMEYAFQEVKLDKIIAACNEKNVASFRVMEKCGMRRIKTENHQKALKNGIEVTYNKLTYCIERE